MWWTCAGSSPPACQPASPLTPLTPPFPPSILQVVDFCREQAIGFALVGPEQPLVEGLVDALEAAGVPSFGPTAAAARLEGSKAFMKGVCRKYGIPTAAYETFTSPADAKAYIRGVGAPVVVKTSGLAAGKGVTVAASVEEALAAVDAMMVEGVFGAAGATVVVEEFLDGEEASFFALVDGESCIPLVGAQVGGQVAPRLGGRGARKGGEGRGRERGGLAEASLMPAWWCARRAGGLAGLQCGGKGTHACMHAA